MTLRAVLFDLDDTLHDDTAAQLGGAERVAAEVAAEHAGVSAPALVAAYLAESDAFWHALGPDSLTASPGEVRQAMWSRALGSAGVADGDGVLGRRYGARYNTHRRALFTLFPEALPLLADLRARGVATVMITNGLAETHRDKIAALALEAAFDLVFIADEVGFVKPDERVFLLACERLGVPAGACAMVGDRYDRDIRTPIALGMRTIWMNVRREPLPAGDAPPDADVPDLAGVVRALAPLLPPA